MSTPVYPKPGPRKISMLWSLIKRRRSWLDGVYERSYRMKMGEVSLPMLKMFMPNQPEHVKKILLDEYQDFPKHELLAEQLRPLLGDSIFTTNGAVWQRQRDMLDVAFNNAQVERVFGAMQSAVGKMNRKIAVKARAGVFDIDEDMTLVTADVIFRTIMSTELDTDVANDILSAFERFQKKTSIFVMLRMLCVPATIVDRFLLRARVRDARLIRLAIEKAIQPRYEKFLGSGFDDGEDILAQILNAKDADGRHFELFEVVDQVAMLFLAGHETSAAALTWALYLLAINPDWQEKIRGEVLSLGDEDTWTASKLKQCPSLRYVFMETLRLYPPVGFFMREIARPQCLREKVMKKGDIVLLSPWLLQRHEGVWNAPHEFCPARFDRHSEEFEAHRNAYIPFSTGPRVCIGAAFAMQEAYLILASIVAGYSIKLADAFEPKPIARLTVRSENGLQVKLTDIKKAAS